MSAGVALSSLRSGERIDPSRRQLKIAELADDIAARGLLCPLLVTPERLIIDGERRRAALELLEQQGRSVPALVRILATAKEAIDLLGTEWAANEQREPHTAEAKVSYARRRLALEEQAKAAERRREGGAKGGRSSGTADPELGDVKTEGEDGRAKARAAKAAGFASRKAFERAAEVVDAAKAEPEKYGELLAELNATGKTEAMHRKLQRAQAAGGIHDPDSYSTQRWILAGIHDVEPDGLALDPCSNELARRLGFVDACVSWTIDDDARRQPTWRVCEVTSTKRGPIKNGRYVVFFQPPYSCPDDGDKPGTLGPDDPGCPGLTSKLVECWDAGEFDAVYALVKDDASTEWWAMLRDRAAFLIKPRKRLAHVVGIDDEGHEIEHDGSDFNSAMHVLSRGTKVKLLELRRKLAARYEGQADVYTAAWVLDLDDEPELPLAAKLHRARKAPPRPGLDPSLVVWPEDAKGDGNKAAKRGAKPRKVK